MADTARPQTPTRKLFKAASKTKTPTPVKKIESPTSQHQSSPFAQKARSEAGGSGRKLFSGSSSPKLVRKYSTSTVGSTSRAALEDISKTTSLAPLTATSEAARENNLEYAASDATGDTPIGLIDNDIDDPSDPTPGVADATKDLSNKPSESVVEAPTEVPLGEPEGTGKLEKSAIDAPEVATETVPEQDGALETISAGVDVATGSPEDLATDIPEEAATLDEEPERPTDLAKYFEEKGHPEMGQFLKALTASTEPTMGSGTSKDQESAKDDTEPNTEETQSTVADAPKALPDTDVGLPTPDTLANDASVKAKDAVDDSTSKAPTTSTTSDKTIPDSIHDDAAQTVSEAKDTTSKISTDLPKEASEPVGETTLNAPDVPGAATNKDIGEDTSEKASTIKQPLGDATELGAQTPRASTPGTPRVSKGKVASGGATNAASSGSPQVVDNSGKPSQINRRIEIPLPRPETPRRATPKSTEGPIADLSGVASVDELKSTEGLANVNDLDDPPEEFLDPEIHSPRSSASISPIPKISRVAPISSKPPPDLFRLAHGLGGHTVDDVANIVDEAGKILGHATGDLPAMVGKKVSDNGEIYGDGGELIGYVTENFTGYPPPPTETPLPGGLSVDTSGNIRDSSGNIVGKLNRPAPKENGAITPYVGTSSKPENPRSSDKQEPQQEEQPKEKFNNGIPADIFLDVKSTPDGIQLTIRIPTVFKQEPQRQQESQNS